MLLHSGLYKDSNTISGISKHVRECSHGKVDWDKPVILKTIIEQNKASLQMKLLIQESLEIKKNKSLRNGYNDPQLQVDTSAWDLILMKLQKLDNKNLKKAKKGRHGD